MGENGFNPQLLQHHASTNPHLSLTPISTVRSRGVPCSLPLLPLPRAQLWKRTVWMTSYISNWRQTSLPHLRIVSHCSLQNKTEVERRKEVLWPSAQRPHNCCPFQLHLRQGSTWDITSSFSPHLHASKCNCQLSKPVVGGCSLVPSRSDPKCLHRKYII